MNELIARVGTEVSVNVTTNLALSARVSIGVDLLNERGTTTAQFTDGTGAITVHNDARSRTVGELSLGLRYQVSPTWSLSAGLSGEARRHQREGAIDLRSTWTF